MWDLSDEDIELWGSEDGSTVSQRVALTKKLSILEDGLEDLDAFTARSADGRTAAMGLERGV
jgi:hypothetical protein